MDTCKNDILVISDKGYNNNRLMPILKGVSNGSKNCENTTDWLPNSLNNVFSACGIEDAYEVIYENIWEETLNPLN